MMSVKEFYCICMLNVHMFAKHKFITMNISPLSKKNPENMYYS